MGSHDVMGEGLVPCAYRRLNKETGSLISKTKCESRWHKYWRKKLASKKIFVQAGFFAAESRQSYTSWGLKKDNSNNIKPLKRLKQLKLLLLPQQTQRLCEYS
jgi:hypothetical protein